MIGAIGRVLNRVEGDIELLHERLQKHAYQIDILGITVEIDETIFGLSAAGSGELDIRNGLIILYE